MDTVVLPTPPTSGAIMSSSNYSHGYDAALAELITNNNVAETSREILAAIGTGNASIISNIGVNSVAALNATNLASVSNLKATGDASIAGINATNLAGVAGIKQTTDASVALNKNVTDGVVSTTKTVTDYGLANTETTNRNATAITKAITDASLASGLSFGEVRSLISTEGTANAIAAKDIQIAIFRDGCDTRDKSAAQFSSLQKDMADAKYEALRNKCDLEKQIAEVCCCIDKATGVTNALILSENTKRLESELSEARLKAAIAGLGTCDKGK